MNVKPAFLALLLFSTSSAYGERQYDTALQAAERVKRDERQLARRVHSLSAEERRRLKISFRGRDSDRDGISDIVEGGLGSNRCDTDSDDDGIDDSKDRDERRWTDDGGRPGDDNCQMGNCPEIAARGRITSFIDPRLTVSGKTFIITANTVFRDFGLSKEGLIVGQCIEIEGHASGAGIIADKVHLEDSGC